MRPCWYKSIRPDASCVPPSRPSPAPCGRNLLSARTGIVRVRMNTQNFKNKIKIFFFFFLGSCCRLEKRKQNFRFSVFNPRDPQAPQALRAKPQEEEGFFGLVPLVTHPSSIPLLGGLTPKFLSLFLHSF
jgi:hypothetical protein